MYTLTLWGSSEACTADSDITVYWNQYPDTLELGDRTVYSLPAQVSAQSVALRGEYLSWLAKAVSPSKKTHLPLRRFEFTSGLHAWLLTIPTQYAFYPSSFAYSFMRLSALFQIIDGQAVNRVQVFFMDATTARVIREWCISRNIDFVSYHEQGPQALNHYGARHFVRQMLALFGPYLEITLSLLKKYFVFFSLTRPNRFVSQPAGASTVILDYWAHIDQESALSGRFISNYWGTLPSRIVEDDFNPFWFHIAITNSRAAVLNARRACKSLRAHTATQHWLLQDHFSVGVGIHALLTSFRLQRRQGKMFKHLSLHNEQMGVDLRAMALSCWQSELTGRGLAQNALWLYLYKRTARSIKAQSPIIYLMENQPWELMMQLQWQKYNGGSRTGVIHSVAHVNDTRYALAQVGTQARLHIPAPDVITTMDHTSSSTMRFNGIDPQSIRQLEALRYLIDNDSTSLRARARKNPGALKLLVVGEYDPRMSDRQVQLISACLQRSDQDLHVAFRPHPASQYVPAALPPTVVITRSKRIQKDLVDADAVLLSNSSFAVIDIRLAAIPYAIFLDGRILDRRLGAEWGDPNVVHNSTDLIDWLQGDNLFNRETPVSQDTNIDRNPQIPNWMAFLREIRTRVA